MCAEVKFLTKRHRAPKNRVGGRMIANLKRFDPLSYFIWTSFVLLFSLFVLLNSLHEIDFEKKKASWPHSFGVIEGVDLVYGCSKNGGVQPFIRYAYVYASRAHEGNEGVNICVSWSVGDKVENSYPVGSRIEILVNPQRPSESLVSSLERPPSLRDLFLPLVISAVAGVLFVSGYFLWRAERGYLDG